MFRQITYTHVESDAGFSLKSGSRDFWIYSEGKREIYVTREALHAARDDASEAIYLSALPDCWAPPNNIYAISQAKREEIAANVQAALQFLGVKFRIE